MIHIAVTYKKISMNLLSKVDVITTSATYDIAITWFIHPLALPWWPYADYDKPVYDEKAFNPKTKTAYQESI